MPRYRKSSAEKAKNTPMSLTPKHLNMLQDLEKHFRMGRSKVVQHLIEREYDKLKKV